jgi:hypothetical protein
MMSNLHDPYGLGCRRNTMAKTTRGNGVIRSKSFKLCLSSDWGLQLAPMKSESLVIADQHAAVNMFLGLVHTARHVGKFSGTRKLQA